MTALPALRRITQRVPGVQPTQSLGDVLRIFANHPSVRALVVLTGAIPTGVICRELIGDVVGLPCYRAWIDRQSCLQFVSHPACVLDVEAGARELARVLAPDPHRHPAEPVVVTADGAYLGVVERQALMGAIAAVQQRALAVVSRSGRSIARDRPIDIASVDYSHPCHASEPIAPRFRKH